jgi:hypothetical protein
MPMIEIDANARDILLKWKRIFGESIGARFDYSEAIRKADDCIAYPEYQDPLVRDKKLGRSGVRPRSIHSSASSKSRPSTLYRRDKSGRFSSKPSRRPSRKSLCIR